MSTTGNLVKWWPPVSDKPKPEETALHTRLLFDTANDHDQAITALKGQLDEAIATKSTNTVTTVTNTVLSTQFPGLGTVNDQTGETSYATQSSDNGALIIVDDASPVAVALNSVVSTPYFFFISNFGAGTATLTPSSGTINGSASFALPQNYFSVVFFDGTNWEATILLVLPQDTPEVAHEWLDSYDATTGLFTQSQPAFSDVSGTATAAQVPALSALTGAITASQLPTAVPVVSFGSGAPSGSSTEAYVYFDTSGSPYTGYVYHLGAWQAFS